MSFYYEHNLKFSYHAIHRIRERLNLPNLDDFQLKDKVIQEVNNSSDIFYDNKYKYIKLDSYPNIYLLVDKSTSLIITASPMSQEKILKIFS